MPTRRIMELILVVGVLSLPALASVKLWAQRQLGSQPEDSFLHTVGEVVIVVLP